MSMEEGRKLQRITRTAKDPVRLRRAIVVMMSAQGQSVPAITSLMQVTDDYVRDVIHAFNERGFEALDPKWSGGRPPTISQDTRERICLIARTVPAELRVLVELDRVRVRRTAVLRPQRHRPPQPRQAERRYRRLRPELRQAGPPQDQLRPELTHPQLDQLPGRGCVTSH
ncbi:helix-turn-helix domain-containing protein [Actinospica sp. MGRD01-02]|uniref:Helix-turn-helix domain-containing protein n=1 Tax=Actinospica acidithermotolerans TaxID=2828514 RepID=A0A941IMW7_9ACTN|nr:helix-turn-helix domain-containing protein [Actinospica acidithermotolerans]